MASRGGTTDEQTEVSRNGRRGVVDKAAKAGENGARQRWMGSGGRGRQMAEQVGRCRWRGCGGEDRQTEMNR
eukprot:scaffold198398_cov12-Tisochrysis_lutea.AAC.1